MFECLKKLSKIFNVLKYFCRVLVLNSVGSVGVILLQVLSSWGASVTGVVDTQQASVEAIRAMINSYIWKVII